MNKEFLAIDVGGTFIKSAILNSNGEIIESESDPTVSVTLNDFKAILDNIINRHLNRVSGLGLSIPGTVDNTSGIVYHGGSLPYLDQFAIGDYLEQKYQIPVFIENDGKAAAQAELWQGNLQGVQSGIVITLGTGVGGGLIINNNLYRGVNLQAGELSFLNNSHKENEYLGLKCSAVAMIKKISREMNLSTQYDGKIVFELINNRESPAWEIFVQYSKDVAELIYTLQVILDLDTIVVSGGISSQDIVTSQINEEFKLLLEQRPLAKGIIRTPKILKAKFSKNANLYGAIYPFFI